MSGRIPRNNGIRAAGSVLKRASVLGFHTLVVPFVELLASTKRRDLTPSPSDNFRVTIFTDAVNRRAEKGETKSH